MKHLKFAFIAAVIVSLGVPNAFSQNARKPVPKATPQPMPLNLLATLVKNAVDECKADKSLPDLTSAEFGFKVQTQTTAGGTVSVWIVTVGASRTEDNISDVKFTYDKPEPSSTKGIEPLGFNGPNLNALQDRLTGVIKGAAKSLKSVPSVEEAKFHKLTVTVTYQVKAGINASANIPIWSIVFGPKLDINQTNTHSITLVFSKPTTPTPGPKPSATPVATASSTPPVP